MQATRVFKYIFVVLGFVGFFFAVGFAGDPTPNCTITVWGQIAGMFGGIAMMAVGYEGACRCASGKPHR